MSIYIFAPTVAVDKHLDLFNMELYRYDFHVFKRTDAFVKYKLIFSYEIKNMCSHNQD